MIKFTAVKKNLIETSYTWLVTGAAGFIGSNLVESLLLLNQKVIALDNFSTGSKENIHDLLKKLSNRQKKLFEFHEGDIRHTKDCEKVTKNVDFVLHQAALGSVPRSIATPHLTNETNVTGFLNILQAARNNGVKRFVYASSSSVYGDSPHLPKSEDHLGKPLSPYAVSKYANELYAIAFANCYDIETIGLRYFNVFGPRQSPNGPYAAVIPLWIHALLNKQPIYINGDGETSRDFCYVANAVQINLLSALTHNKEAINKIYNTTVGEKTTLNELYHLLSTVLNVDTKPMYRDFRQGDIRHSLADLTLAKSLLGYEPEYVMQQGLTETIQWFKNQNNDKKKMIS